MPSRSNPPIWLLLACRACGTKMKLRPESAAGGRVLCPACRAVVPDRDIQAALSAPVQEKTAPVKPAAPPAPVAPRPPEPDPLYRPRDLTRPVGPADIPFQPLRSTEEMMSQPQEVRRKRKAGNLTMAEVADWDSKDSLDFVPEAELTADEWTRSGVLPEESAKEKERVYVVGEGMTADGSRAQLRKRVRKRRNLAGARLFFQRFTRLTKYIVLGLAVLIAVVGVAYGIKSSHESTTAPEPPPPPADLIAPPDRALLTDYDRTGARKAIEDFMGADTVEKKLAFVRLPDRVRPLMEKWYQDHPLGPFKLAETKHEQKLPDKNGYFVMMAVPVITPSVLVPGTADEIMNFFAVEEVRTGSTSTYLLDWEVSNGYQPIPLDRFKDELPKVPQTMRLKMRLADHYIHNYSERAAWQSVELYYPRPDGPEWMIYGYIARGTPEGRKLLALLPEITLDDLPDDPIQGVRTVNTSVIIDIVYPPEVLSREQVEVVKLHDESWFIRGPGAPQAPGSGTPDGEKPAAEPGK